MEARPVTRRDKDHNATSFFDASSAPTSIGGENPAALEGEILKGAFRVDAVLGAGGMGIVYRGTQLSLGRAVAIKTLASSTRLSEATVQRFFREARILSQLSHPNVVSIIDFGTASSQATPFIVMELLSGKPLDSYVTPQNRLPLRQVMNIMGQICAGIAAAHHSHIIHRDLKPSNVFVVTVPGSTEPIIKLLDFGLARPVQAPTDTGRPVTQTGVGVGTCGFTAPEQLEGVTEPDVRADVYGLGALLYFLLTGRAPYQGPSSSAILVKQMTAPPDSIDFPALGLAGAEAIEPIVLKAMSIQPQDRYQSALEFKGALEAILTTILSRPDRLGPANSSAATEIGHGQPTRTGPARTSATAKISGDGTPIMPRSRVWMAAAGVLGLGVCVLAGWLVTRSLTDHKPVLTATAPGVTAMDITLGLSAPFSGPAKELGRGMQTGIETYFQYINESLGGVHGRKLKLLALDDGYDPNRCVETVTKLLDETPVFAFIGNVGTPTAEKTLQLILDHKRVLFGAFTGTSLLRQEPPDRYVFNFRPSYAEETAAIVHYLLTVRKIKADQIAVFAQQDGYGDAGFAGVAKALRKVGADAEKIVRVGYKRNTMDLDAAVNELLKQKDRVKAVVMVPTYNQAAAFIKRVRDGGMHPIFTSVSFVGSEALAEALKETAPKYGAGVIVTQVVPYYQSSATTVLQYRERLKKHFPAEQPGFVSLEGYIDAQILATALEKAGPELTTDRVVEALESLHLLDLGLGTPINFGPSEHQGSHKVWATILDEQLQFQSLDLD